MNAGILARLSLQNRSARGTYAATSGSFQHIYQGSMEDVYALIGSITWEETDPGGLFPLVAAEPSQVDGPRWAVTLRYQGELGGAIGITSGPRFHSLDCRPLSLPLATLSKYLLSWDHYLFGAVEAPASPAWWMTAKKWTDIPAEDRKKYRISKNLDYYNTLQPLDGVGWQILGEPVKKGVPTRTVFVYEIEEWNTHRSESKAAWASLKAGEIVTKPPLGDFGVNAKSGGNWRNWGGKITPQSREFEARVTYKHMPGDGWDSDLVEAIINASKN